MPAGGATSERILLLSVVTPRKLDGIPTALCRAKTRFMAANVYRSETRFRAVSWIFAAGSLAWMGPSRGADVARLPLGEVPVGPAGGAGPV
jgi:hypothetical protein